MDGATLGTLNGTDDGNEEETIDGREPLMGILQRL
jgi:hypothetical protein